MKFSNTQKGTEDSHTRSMPKLGKSLVLKLSVSPNPVRTYQFLAKHLKKMEFRLLLGAFSFSMTYRKNPCQLVHYSSTLFMSRF